MAALDILLLAVIAGFALFSLSAGFVREAVSLLALLLGILVAGRTYAALARQFPAFPEPWPQILAFVLILGVFLAVGWVLASVLANSAGVVLGPFDKLAGLLLGIVKGLVVCQVIVIAMLRFPLVDMRGPLTESRLGAVLVAQVPLVVGLLPPEFANVIRMIQP